MTTKHNWISSKQVNESDPLPNFVCQKCWRTTESFHLLYEQSKLVEEKFLNPLIKTDVEEVFVANSENQFTEEAIDVGEIKVEPQLGEKMASF